MKKIILIVMATILALSVACSQADTNGAVNGKKQGTVPVGAENKPGVDGDEKKAERNYPPMVKVAGVVYKDTSYENAMVTCGTADGEIKTTVDGTKKPANDDESNFGKGYGYQIWDEGYLNVRVNDRWVLFKALDLEDYGQIPKWVAHFTARVIEADEDSLMVKATAIEDAFYFKDQMTKPVLLPIENLDHGKDGFVTTKGLEGKTVEVYFGGEIKNTEPESSAPIVLETVYKIRPID